MDFNKILTGFIKNNKVIVQQLSETIGKFGDQADADAILLKLGEAINTSKYNPAFGIYFAGMLNLSSKKETIDQIVLEEIEELYQTLLTMQDYNLETYYAAAIFEMNEMEDNEEAKNLIYLGIEKAEEKIKELKELLAEIDSE